MAPSDPTAAVVLTGTTGHVGGVAAKTLRAAGVPFRQLVRDPGAVPAGTGDDVVRVAGLDDHSGIRRAVPAGATVFMVSAFADHDERMRLHRGFVDALVAAGAGRVVYLSFVGAAPSAVFLHAQSHGETEEYIRATGMPYTFLRTSYYYWALAHFITDGVLSGGGGRVGWVAPDDCGRAVAAALLDPSTAGRTYDITGPDAIGFAEAARRLSDCLGRRVTYRREDDVDRIPLAGVPDWARAHRRSSHRSFAAGEADIVTDAVAALTGRAPVGLEEYVTAHPEPFHNPAADA